MEGPDRTGEGRDDRARDVFDGRHKQPPQA